MNERAEPFAVAVLIVALCAAFCVCASAVESQETSSGPRREENPSNSERDSLRASAVAPALHLARQCRLEADFSLADCAGIYHVGLARFGDRWLRGLMRYTHLYARSNARARSIARLPWDDVHGWPHWRNRNWSRLREHAARLVMGEVGNPCPGAVHWGGLMDHPAPSLRRVRCNVRTANRFYRVVRRAN